MLAKASSGGCIVPLLFIEPLRRLLVFWTFYVRLIVDIYLFFIFGCLLFGLFCFFLLGLFIILAFNYQYILSVHSRHLFQFARESNDPREVGLSPKRLPRKQSLSSGHKQEALPGQA